MADPLFWLALSFLLVVVSLTAVLMVAIPALRELGRAARSAEKLFDTLGRELPPTLEAIRLTGLEITELTDDVTEGVQSAGQVVQQVNQSLVSAQTQAKRLNTGTKSFLAGARAAWQAWTTEPPSTRTQPRPQGRERPRPTPHPAVARPKQPVEQPLDWVDDRAADAAALEPSTEAAPGYELHPLPLEETALHTMPLAIDPAGDPGAEINASLPAPRAEKARPQTQTDWD